MCGPFRAQRRELRAVCAPRPSRPVPSPSERSAAPHLDSGIKALFFNPKGTCRFWLPLSFPSRRRWEDRGKYLRARNQRKSSSGAFPPDTGTKLRPVGPRCAPGAGPDKNVSQTNPPRAHL